MHSLLEGSQVCSVETKQSNSIYDFALQEIEAPISLVPKINKYTILFICTYGHDIFVMLVAKNTLTKTSKDFSECPKISLILQSVAVKAVYLNFFNKPKS